MGSVKLDVDGQRSTRSSRSQRDAYGRDGRDERDQRDGSKDVVYVNQAYDGSTGDVSRRSEPPTTVIREQYWACSRWPAFQKILVISVAILFGLVIGLAIWVALAHKENPPISEIFQRAHVAPD